MNQFLTSAFSPLVNAACKAGDEKTLRNSRVAEAGVPVGWTLTGGLMTGISQVAAGMRMRKSLVKTG